MNITTNLIYNLTTNTNNLKYICEVDTLSMIDNINKTPKYAFFFLIGAMILITLYLFWINRTKNEWIKEHIQKDFIILPYLLILSSIYLYFFTTFSIDSTQFFKVVQPILYIICGILIIKIGYDIYKKRKEAKE